MTAVARRARRPIRIRPVAVLLGAILIAAVTQVSAILVHPTRPPTAATNAASTGGELAADPADPGHVTGGVGVTGAQFDWLANGISVWTRKLSENSQDYISATNLGSLYLQRARLTANIDDYDRAARSIAQALVADPGYESGRTVELNVLFATHQFATALEHAQSLLADDSGNLQARATVADSQLELGRYAAAQDSYRLLTAIAKGPPIDARLAHLAFVTGDPAKALALAKAARDAAVIAADDPHSPDLAFYEYQLGEIARLTGDPTLAGSAYRAALIDRPEDLASLVGLARVEAHDGDAGAAIAQLRRAAAIAPQPDTLALLGDLLEESGDPRGATQEYATVRAIRTLSETASSVYDRQLLLFELDHGGATEPVLEGARIALAARGDVYGHDVVAWALYRLGRPGQAKAEMAAAMAQGTPDARLLYHAGAIDLASGDRSGGARLLRQAIALSSGLDPLQLAEATRLLSGA